jgi:hypothetical protein
MQQTPGASYMTYPPARTAVCGPTCE